VFVSKIVKRVVTLLLVLCASVNAIADQINWSDPRRVVVIDRPWSDVVTAIANFHAKGIYAEDLARTWRSSPGAFSDELRVRGESFTYVYRFKYTDGLQGASTELTLARVWRKNGSDESFSWAPPFTTWAEKTKIELLELARKLSKPPEAASVGSQAIASSAPALKEGEGMAGQFNGQATTTGDEAIKPGNIPQAPERASDMNKPSDILSPSALELRQLQTRIIKAKPESVHSAFIEWCKNRGGSIGSVRWDIPEHSCFLQNEQTWIKYELKREKEGTLVRIRETVRDRKNGNMIPTVTPESYESIFKAIADMLMLNEVGVEIKVLR